MGSDGGLFWRYIVSWELAADLYHGQLTCVCFSRSLRRTSPWAVRQQSFTVVGYVGLNKNDGYRQLNVRQLGNLRPWDSIVPPLSSNV